jgi:putative aldouronate transport system substrate-binding protein
MFKKRKYLRCLPIVLAVALIGTTLVGCKSNAATSSSSSSTNTVKTLTCFINETWYSTNSWTGIVPDAITAKTGVALKISRAADANQLGLMIASGSLPDIVFSDSNISKLSDPSICYAWQDLIPKYAPKWTPDPERVKTAQTLSKDGKYYTLLSAFESTQMWKDAKTGGPTVPMLFARQDLLQKLGNPPLNTLADFENVLALVKKNYPDMTPIVLDPTWLGSVFKNWFGAIDMVSYQIVDGKMEYHISAPQYKAYLKFMNSLYQKGYFKAENFAFTSDADSKKFLANGNAFFYTWCTQDPDLQLNTLVKTTDGAKYEAVGNLGGDTTLNVRPTNGWAGNFITKNCKDLTSAVKFYQFMYSDEGIKLGLWGRKGTDWTESATGGPVFSADMVATRKIGQDAVTAKYNNNWLFGDTFPIEAAGNAATAGADFQKILTDLRGRVQVEPQIMWCTPKDGTDEQIIQSKLDDYVKNQEVKVIISKTDAEFVANYNAEMATATQLGIDKLNTAVDAAYQKVK